MPVSELGIVPQLFYLLGFFFFFYAKLHLKTPANLVNLLIRHKIKKKKCVYGFLSFQISQEAFYMQR